MVYSPPSPLNYFPITLLPSLLPLLVNISQHMFIGMKKNTKNEAVNTLIKGTDSFLEQKSKMDCRRAKKNDVLGW